MKKSLRLFCIFAVTLLSMTSCRQPEPKPNIVSFCESLLKQYPNYRSNDYASLSIKDSIQAYCEKRVNKIADFSDLVFTYEDIIEGQNGPVVVFKSIPLCAEVDAPKGSIYQTVTAYPVIRVCTLTTPDIASKLDKSVRYKVSGVVHAWDETNMLGRFDPLIRDDYELDFGIFFLENETATIEPIIN